MYFHPAGNLPGPLSYDSCMHFVDDGSFHVSDSAHHRIIQHATQPGKEMCARPQARQDKIKTIRTLIFTADDAADLQ